MSLADSVDPEAFTAEDITSALANVSGELRYLWTSNDLPQKLMAALASAGFGSMNTFSSLAEDKASTAVVMRTGFGVDETTSLKNRGLVVRVYNAIESAKKRRTKQDELDAEARSSRLPKLIPKEDFGRMKTAFESAEHSLDEKETPSQNLVERRLNMIEADEPKILKWEELTSLQDPEEELNGVGFDAQGILKLRPGTHTATIPQTPEQLRMRHKVSAHAWIFAGYKATACKWLKGFNIKVYTDLSDYVLGEHVMGLESRDASNQVVGRAPWALVISYAMQVEKRAYKFVCEGETLVAAMKKARDCTTTKERFFTTPLSVSPKTLVPDGGTRTQDTWQWKGSQFKGGKGKGYWWDSAQDWSQSWKGGKKGGKKGGHKMGGQKGTKKGANKGGKGLARLTPDGRPICFAFNAEGCSGPPGCNRVHVCRKCFGEHSMAVCPT